MPYPAPFHHVFTAPPLNPTASMVDMSESSRPIPRPLLVGVDGRSGAGKTQLVVGVRSELTALGHTVAAFSLDEIYPGWDGLRAGVEQYVSAILPRLATGDTAQYRRWDWYAHGLESGVDGAPGKLVSLQPGDVVLCEGVGATVAEARRWLDLSIWVDAPEDLRRRRALLRDGDSYRGHWRQWAVQEELLLQESGSGSGVTEHDVVVKSTESPQDTARGTAAVDEIVTRVEGLLRAK